MAKIAIPTSTVTCTDGTTDVYVGTNPNTAAGDKVQAFVDCFKNAAQHASTNCLYLPPKFILAQWGGESGWATGSTQKTNQNWSNIIYTSSSNPPGNSGSGAGGWAKFCGRTKHAYGYARFFWVNTRYSVLTDYLIWCDLKGLTPDEYYCARYIADAGYGGADHDAYYDSLEAWMNTLCNHSDYC